MSAMSWTKSDAKGAKLGGDGVHKHGEGGTTRIRADHARQRATFDAKLRAAQELVEEQRRAENVLRDALAGYVGLSQEMSSKVKEMEDNDRRRREAEETFASTKPFASTTLEERRLGAENSRLQLNLKLANDKACRLQIENSNLKDELKAHENISPLSSIGSNHEVTMEELARLRRQVKTKETLCTTVINELQAVRKELVNVTAKRDQLSLELHSQMKDAGEQTHAAQATEGKLQARVKELEEVNRQLNKEVWGDSGPQLAGEGKPLMRKDLVRINRQWEAAYKNLKQEHTKLKIRTADSEGNPTHRRKKQKQAKRGKGDGDGHGDKDVQEAAAMPPPVALVFSNQTAVSGKRDTADKSTSTDQPAAVPAASPAAAASAAAASAAAASAVSEAYPTTVISTPGGKSVVRLQLPLSMLGYDPVYPVRLSETAVANQYRAIPPLAAAAAECPPSPSAMPPLVRDNSQTEAHLLTSPASGDTNATSPGEMDLSHELESSKAVALELQQHISKLQQALHEKRSQLAEEKEQHEVTMAEKESLVSALSAVEKAKLADASSEELQRLRLELNTSIKSEQRLQRELDTMQSSHRQDNIRLEELHKELLRVSNEKRKLESDLSEATGRLSAIETTLGKGK